MATHAENSDGEGADSDAYPLPTRDVEGVETTYSVAGIVHGHGPFYSPDRAVETAFRDHVYRAIFGSEPVFLEQGVEDALRDEQVESQHVTVLDDQQQYVDEASAADIARFYPRYARDTVVSLVRGRVASDGLPALRRAAADDPTLLNELVDREDPADDPVWRKRAKYIADDTVDAVRDMEEPPHRVHVVTGAAWTTDVERRLRDQIEGAYPRARYSTGSRSMAGF